METKKIEEKELKKDDIKNLNERCETFAWGIFFILGGAIFLIPGDQSDEFLGWDNQDDLNPMFAWEFKKNDFVRLGKGSYTPKIEFWKRDVFAITYTQEGLSQFIDHQICIDRLKNKVKTDKCFLGKTF